MANLETLELEINGSATGASSGIQALTASLSALASVVANNVSGLRQLKSALNEVKAASSGVKSIGNIIPATANAGMANIRKSADATVQAVDKVEKAGAKVAELYKAHPESPMPSDFPYKVLPNQITPELRAQNMQYASDRVAAANKAREDGIQYIKQQAQAVEEVKTANNEAAKAAKTAATANNEYAESAKSVTKATAQVKVASKTTTSFFSQIARIAKTMLIRTAIRAVMKLAKEGLQNYYNYAKSIGSTYASAMDSLSISTSIAGNQLGAAIASLLAQIQPILSAIISVVTAVAEAITMLFSLLGGGTTWSKATNGANGFAKAVGGGGSAMKELLADFDELNVIASQGGGGGGGGGGAGGWAFEEIALPQWMIEWKPLIEALLAGTLGAIILPKIWEWIKKIFGLGTTPGADVVKKVFDNFLKFKTNDLPDFTKMITQLITISVVGGLAAAAIDKLAEAFAKLKAALEGVDLLKKLAEVLLLQLFGDKKIKVELDTSKYKPVQEEIVKWLNKKETKYYSVAFDNSIRNFDSIRESLSRWAKAVETKLFAVAFNNSIRTFDNQRASLTAWANKLETKYFAVAFNNSTKAFDSIRSSLTAWANRLETKYFAVAFNNSTRNFDSVRSSLTVWANRLETKYFAVAFNSSTRTFDSIRNSLSAWANRLETKYFAVAFNNSTRTFDLTRASLTSWVSRVETKYFAIAFNNSIRNFDSQRASLTNWANKSETKTFRAAFNTESYNRFREDMRLIDAWANATPEKTIAIQIDFASYAGFVAAVASVAAFMVMPTAKLVAIGVEPISLFGFESVKAMIDNWCSTVATKTVVIETVQKSGGGGGNSGNGSGSTFVDAVSSWVSDSIDSIVDFSANAVNEIGKAFDNIFGPTKLVKNFGGPYATGGMPDRGDLFIANEAGAELIGSINGRTSVANQEQIMEGIQRGVESANAEQNELLRQQNNLLARILQKDSTVRIGASAALGRTVSQSLNMYNSVVGG